LHLIDSLFWRAAMFFPPPSLPCEGTHKKQDAAFLEQRTKP
jgi:hypothetical protein